jgi:hypothetical protein
VMFSPPRLTATHMLIEVTSNAPIWYVYAERGDGSTVILERLDWTTWAYDRPSAPERVRFVAKLTSHAEHHSDDEVVEPGEEEAEEVEDADSVPEGADADEDASAEARDRTNEAVVQGENTGCASMSAPFSSIAAAILFRLSRRRTHAVSRRRD